MGINMKNAEGYHDPTPHKAVNNITSEDKADNKMPVDPFERAEYLYSLIESEE